MVMARSGMAHRWLSAFVIAIVVSAGSSGPSRAAELPGVPTDLVAAAGDGFAILRWNPPVDDGGSPITSYLLINYAEGVAYFSGEVFPVSNELTLGESLFVFNTLEVVFTLRACNDAGCGSDSEPSNEVLPTEGASAPQSVLAPISPAGGSVATDADTVEPSAANPVITAVTVPPTLGGGSLSIAETTPLLEVPTGFAFLGQSIVIESTAPTDASNPLSITFRVDPSQVPVTILRDGAPITAGCTTSGIADPAPCIAAGAGTASITILTDHASTWNVGIATYAFGGFTSPVDNLPVTNLAKPGRAIPVRFSLGGDQGTNVFAAGSPSSHRVACDSSGTVDGIEETLSTPGQLTYSPGTGLYQLGWNTDRSWGGTCRELVLRFRDGSEARARFAFR
jgi:hypothetical protein